jgi:hypothetical protein
LAENAQSELYFTDVNWPAFREIDFLRGPRVPARPSGRRLTRTPRPQPSILWFDHASARRGFFPLPPVQAYTRTTAILVYELDASAFKSASNYLEGCSTRRTHAGLDLTNGYNPNPGPICKVLLSPVEQSACCPALCRIDHRGTMAKESDSLKSVENRLTGRHIYFRYFSCH